MSKNIDWIIHFVANGVVCEECGKEEDSFIPNACNAHTHGMERYGHLDFQIVLKYPIEDVCYLLNTLGLRVQSGEMFRAGEFVEGLFSDCAVRLDEEDECGRKVLRVVIPDKHNVFPGDPKCMEPYPIQLLSTEALTVSPTSH